VVEDVLAMDFQALTLSTQGLQQPIHAIGLISSGFHDLGVAPALGRGILPSDSVDGHDPEPVAVLSYKSWEKYFSKRPDVLGKVVQLDHKNYAIIIDPLISNKEACCISISTSYGSGPDQIFLDSPKAEWLWEYAQAKDVLVHIHPPLVSIGAASMQQYRLIEAVGRPFDTALSAARMIYSGVFDKYPKLKVLFVHMGGALAPVVCRLDWNWDLNYKGIQNPPIHKVDKNLRKPSEYFKSNIYVDTMGPSAICLKAMIEMCGVDRVLFGTDFGPVPMNPKVHIDLVDDTITDAGDRNKIFSTNTLDLLRLAESAPRLVPRAA
jgi:hypothetical protein